MRLKVELTGLEAVLEGIEDIVNEAKMEQAMGKACAVVERSAKEKAPKGTGELRRSITSKVVNNAGVIEGIVYTPLEYAPYVEFGTGLFAENGNGRKDVPWHYKDDEGNWHSTSGMKPRPYMRPALNENRTKILRILKEGVGND
jgi:HK97 gp10 family phage protein